MTAPPLLGTLPWVDLDALLDDDVACQAEDCDAAAVWRASTRHRNGPVCQTLLLCDPHAGQVRSWVEDATMRILIRQFLVGGQAVCSAHHVPVDGPPYVAWMHL